MDFQELLVADLAELQPQAPESLKEIAYLRLEEKLVRLEFRPGSVVTEMELAQSIGIGRTPVREAVQRLAAAGLLQVLPRRGIRVTDVEPETVVRLLEVSRGLDDAVARGAAIRATPQQRQAFARLAAEFPVVAARCDLIGILRADSEFDSLCISAMNNEHATKMYRLLRPVSRRFWYSRHLQPDDIRIGPLAHGRAASAIADADPERAAKGFGQINDYLETLVRI